MNAHQISWRWFIALACGVGLLAGCESTDSGGSSVGVYYGVGFSDPWYYGDCCGDTDITIKPPPRPDRPVHPSQPIARPPSGSGSRPSARPTPSIPSTPRPAARPRAR